MMPFIRNYKEGKSLVTESESLDAQDQEWMENWLRKGTGTLKDDGNVVYLDCDGDYTNA